MPMTRGGILLLLLFSIRNFTKRISEEQHPLISSHQKVLLIELQLFFTSYNSIEYTTKRHCLDISDKEKRY